MDDAPDQTSPASADVTHRAAAPGAAAAPQAPSPRAGRLWTWSELSWALALGFCLAGLTTLPYLWAFTNQPLDQTYLGYVYNPDEPNVHLSWIRQAAEGALFFRNEFTSEPHEGHFFNLFMLGLGRLAAATGLTPYAIWAIARPVAVVALLVAVWLTTLSLFESASRRRLAVLLVGLSSGLGWLAVARGSGLDVVDVEPNRVMPEAITFLSLYLNPLFTSSMALMLGSIGLGAVALRRGSWPWAVVAGLLGCLLANQHTYNIIPLAFALLAYTIDLTRRDGRDARRWGLLAGMALLILPAVGYQAWLIRSDALYAAKANTITATPSVWTMVVSYGLLGPLAGLGAWRVWRERLEAGRLLVWWATVQLVCIYLPTAWFPFQRKMIEGFHLPLALLATLGLTWAADRAARALARAAHAAQLREFGAVPQVAAEIDRHRAAWRRSLAMLGLLALVPSNALFVLSTIDNVRDNNVGKLDKLMPPFALPDADLQALDWLAANTPRDAVILAMPLVANYMPGRIGRTVYLGHWAETIDFSHKIGQYERFLKGEGTALDKTEWLRANRITYVYMGTYEQVWADNQMPQLPALAQVYPTDAERQPSSTRIYRVRSSEEMRKAAQSGANRAPAPAPGPL